MTTITPIDLPEPEDFLREQCTIAGLTYAGIDLRDGHAVVLTTDPQGTERSHTFVEFFTLVNKEVSA